MSNWKTYKLSDFAELRKEQITPNGIEQPYIGLEHIEQQSLRLNGVGSSKDVISNKYKFYDRDILYGKLRPYFRKVYQPKFDGVCSTDIYVIKNKKGFDKTFLYYLVATEKFTSLANSGSSGTRMPRADWKQLEKSEWAIPDLATQVEIAQILSSFDDKIELLQQMNQTLENIAQEIFENMFVTKNKEDWEEIRLGDIIEIKGGFSYKGQFIGSGDSLLLGMGCVSFNERFLFSGARLYSGEFNSTYLAKSGDIVIATRQQSDNLPILGFPAKVPKSLNSKNVIVGTNLYKVNNHSNFNNAFLFQLFRSNDYRKHILANSKGSTVRMITKDSVENYLFKIPPKEIFSDIETVLNTIDYRIEENTFQIQTLTQTRDTLLPKLMSSQLEIKN